MPSSATGKVYASSFQGTGGLTTLKGGDGGPLFDNDGSRFTQVTYLNGGTYSAAHWWDNTGQDFATISTGTVSFMTGGDTVNAKVQIDASGNMTVTGGANFSGNVDADGILTTGKYVSVNGNGYIRGEYSGELRLQSGTSKISFYNNQNSSELASISNSGSAQFSGTVTANKFVGDGGLTNLPGGGGGGADASNYYTKAESAKYELKGAGGGGTAYTAGNGISIVGSEIKMSGSYTGDFTASGNITAYSDERLKDEISTASIGMIDSIRGVEFTWAESGRQDSGVIAQELEKALPHLVHDNEDGMKSVNYNGLIGYLIEEIKDLKARVRELEG